MSHRAEPHAQSDEIKGVGLKGSDPIKEKLDAPKKKDMLAYENEMGCTLNWEWY
jgi:hypothetical protein